MTSQKPIEYTNKYTSFSRDEILKDVSASMSKKRFKHVLGVEETAIELAKFYGEDIERVSLAALLHDYAKEQAEAEMLDLIISENMDLDLTQYGSAIWHGPVGAILARREFGIEDEEILNAIANHTIGAPTMGLVEQIIFVADYIEPGRDFDGVNKARELAEESIHEAVRYEMEQTIQHLLSNKMRIYPKAIDSYNAWVAN